jgi:predicted RNase H-like nuclease (RuvC/YqgF family)
LNESRKETLGLKAERNSLLVALEGSRAEADGYREYYGRWEATQQQLDETTKILNATIEERDESRRALESLQSVHENSLQNSKKRETATISAYQARLNDLTASAKEDFGKIKKMKAEIASLRKQLEGNGDHREDKVDKENTVSGRELEVEGRGDAGAEQRLKRNFDAAFPDPDGEHSCDTRYPCSI